MAKESLFNVLRNLVDFEDVEALDLFSGTGSISYELISRGVQSVVAVESNSQQVRFIESVKQKLHLTNLRVLRMDVFLFFKNNKNTYDLIFADPPYDMDTFEEVPQQVFAQNLLKEEGIFVLEHSKKFDFSDNPFFFDHRNYGSVNFSFFKNKSSLAE
jgi:16S rRNA (guanine(966)-N(2))-methyltransferase RsmD